MDEKNKILSEKINISNDDFQIFIDNFNLEFDEFDKVVVSCKKIDFKSKQYALNFQSVDNNILFYTNSCGSDGLDISLPPLEQMTH